MCKVNITIEFAFQIFSILFTTWSNKTYYLQNKVHYSIKTFEQALNLVRLQFLSFILKYKRRLLTFSLCFTFLTHRYFI